MFQPTYDKSDRRPSIEELLDRLKHSQQETLAYLTDEQPISYTQFNGTDSRPNHQAQEPAYRMRQPVPAGREAWRDYPHDGPPAGQQPLETPKPLWQQDLEVYCLVWSSKSKSFSPLCCNAPPWMCRNKCFWKLNCVVMFAVFSCENIKSFIIVLCGYLFSQHIFNVILCSSMQFCMHLVYKILFVKCEKCACLHHLHPSLNLSYLYKYIIL